LLQRERSESLENLLAGLKNGDILDATVTRLAPYGAFVELAPFVEGMVHISELSWARTEQAEDTVNPGDRIKVKLLAIHQDAKGNTRISLSRKQAEGDPWDDVEKRLSPGQTTQGKVVRLAPFGAFVELFPGIDGLVHLSEMSFGKRIHSAGDILRIGESVHVVVKEISVEKRRISLSLRDAGAAPPGVQDLDREQHRIASAPVAGAELEKQGGKQVHGIERANVTGGLGIMAQALQNALNTRK
jgi:small subunit ribosomal protein S1